MYKAHKLRCTIVQTFMSTAKDKQMVCSYRSLKKEQKVKHKKTSAWKERKQLEKKQGKEKQQK